ncbi:polysaccharide deacetylase family protein [Paenibacillus sp. GYB003]|uniref:polysaccharide deacetylase family protein n=1 Tax=Paenibacillus sp. GYB003 TaxID=2994392 RepID=UPI002F96D204
MLALIAICIGLFIPAINGPDTKTAVARDVYYDDKAIVLIYHDVRQHAEAESASAGTISTELFGDHLRMLNDRGFRIISMETFVQFMLNGRSIPPNAIAITFDDGYESFYKEAVPVLERYGATASDFIVGISSDLFNSEADPHLNWEQMGELKKCGMGIYSHTYNLHRTVPTDRAGTLMPALTSRMYMNGRQRAESEADYRKRIYSDLAFLEKRLSEELGDRRRLLAFPYGSFSDAVIEEGTKAGIELFFSTEEGMNEPGGRIVKRINAGEPYMTSDMLWQHLQSFFVK